MIQFNFSEAPIFVAPTKDTSVTSRVSPWLTPLLYPLACYAVLPLHFGEIEVQGRENLPTDGPVILAPTHRSRWDPVLVAYAAGRYVTGRDLRFMTSASEFKGIQGWFIRRLGGFPVNINRPTVSSLRHGVELLQEREMLVIFPEGGIFRDGKVHAIKQGLARLSLQAESIEPGLGIKIVPISIHYNQEIPRWGCDVHIKIGKPLSVMDYDHEATKEAAQRLTTDLETALKALDPAQA